MVKILFLISSFAQLTLAMCTCTKGIDAIYTQKMFEQNVNSKANLSVIEFLFNKEIEIISGDTTTSQNFNFFLSKSDTLKQSTSGKSIIIRTDNQFSVQSGHCGPNCNRQFNEGDFFLLAQKNKSEDLNFSTCDQRYNGNMWKINDNQIEVLGPNNNIEWKIKLDKFLISL